MKKLLLFGAALFTAFSINAADYSTIASEADYTITDAQKNASETTETKIVYDITGGQVLDFYMNSESNIHFQITNSGDKAKIFIVNLNNSVEFGGKGGVIIFSNLQVGKKYKVVAAAKGSTAGTLGVIDTDGKTFIGSSIDLPAKAKGADGADEQGYIWKTFEFEATASEMKVKETTGGIRVKEAGASDATGLFNVEAEGVKAVKFMRDGQLYIQRGNKVYNALGAVVEVAE